MKIMSMTGYGRGESADVYSWSVEIKSVNHRYLDIRVRLPRPWIFLEEKIKEYLKKKISRGRVDVFVNFAHTEVPAKVSIDKELLTSFYGQLKEIKEGLGLGGSMDLSLISLMPDALCIEKDFPVEEELWASILPALEDAVEELVHMRLKEGNHLAQDLVSRLENIEAKLDIIEERASLIPEEHCFRLRQQLEKILTPGLNIDQERLEMEVAILAERSCIAEEMVRLSSHIRQLRDTTSCQGLVGKKMDFIAQEMFREANTIAAKTPDGEIVKLIIDIKSEIEKIREQIQNIE